MSAFEENAKQEKKASAKQQEAVAQ
jgi:hypothetical protein